jgi:PilZ domain
MIHPVSMSFPGGRMPRLGDRKPVDQEGELLVKRQGRLGRVKEISIPVQILDVSISGASVRAAADAELVPKQLAVFSVDGAAGNVRLVWIRPDEDGHRMCGLQFLDPRPAFLPTLYRWLGRESEVRPYEDR